MCTKLFVTVFGEPLDALTVSCFVARKRFPSCKFASWFHLESINMEFHGVSLGFHGFPWVFLDSHGFHIDSHGLNMDFHGFPSDPGADRMIFWAPDVLAARLSWETDGGYKVNYEQQGSAMVGNVGDVV